MRPSTAQRNKSRRKHARSRSFVNYFTTIKSSPILASAKRRNFQKLEELSAIIFYFLEIEFKFEYFFLLLIKTATYVVEINDELKSKLSETIAEFEITPVSQVNNYVYQVTFRKTNF